eukprot:gene21960-31731_t
MADQEAKIATAAAQELAAKTKEMQELRDVSAAVSATVPFTVASKRIGDGDAVAEGSKKVHFIRHGQGYHNEAQAAWYAEQGNTYTEPYTQDNDPEFKFIDALLTEKGEGQARELQARTATLAPELLVVSPMRRATQTGLMAFHKHVSEDKTLPVIANDLCHETGGKHTCDKRLSKTKLSSIYPMIDYSQIGEEDPLWGDGLTREDKLSICTRAAKFLEWLKARPEKHVAVAAHSGWLLAVFNGAVAEADAETRTWFATAEMRTVELTFTDK